MTFSGHVSKMYRWAEFDALLARHPCRLLTVTLQRVTEYGSDRRPHASAVLVGHDPRLGDRVPQDDYVALVAAGSGLARKRKQKRRERRDRGHDDDADPTLDPFV